jgi:DNA-binding transcriptional LysR family regulator
VLIYLSSVHLETLKTFCDLAETGSFSKAAVLNRVSQSAVSQQVRMLERHFSQPLIERGHRKGVVLTTAGWHLHSVSKQMVESFLALENELSSGIDLLAGTLRIATVYSVGLHHLPPLVKQFIEANPKVNVRLEYSRTDKVYEACLNNTIDFGIVALPLRKARLEVVPFRREKLVLVCRPDQPLARRRRVSFVRLNGEAFVGFERDIPTRKAIDRLLGDHQVRVSYAMEFDNIETIKRCVEAGIGVTILPENSVVHEVRSGTLVSRGFVEGTFTREIGIIHRRNKVFTLAARAFIDILMKKNP